MSLGEADTGGDGRTKASLRSALQLWQLQQGEDGRSACSASYGGGGTKGAKARSSAEKAKCLNTCTFLKTTRSSYRIAGRAILDL